MNPIRILRSTFAIIGFLSFLTPIAGADDSLRSLFESIRAHEKNELSIVRAPQHASRFRFQTDAQDSVRTDRPVVILIHGLLDSPRRMENLENMAFASGSHVMSIRLPGHFELDATRLDRVSGMEWFQAAEQAYAWASQISDTIILGGHSTGGLIAAVIASMHPETVRKLMLFSPAFKISPQTTLLVHGLTGGNISGSILPDPVNNQFYLSTWAGAALENLIQQLSVRPHSDGRQGRNFSATLEGLKNTEVLWFDTALDIVINKRMNDELFTRLKRINSSAQRLVLPGRYLTIHSQTACLSFLSRDLQIPLIRRFLRSSAN